MKTNLKIIFYGPLGNKDDVIVGGGETGNNRTVNLLTNNGLKVIKIYKPYPKKNAFGYFIYAFQMLVILFKFIAIVIKNPKTKFVHVSGFYSHLIYHEYLLILISRLFRKKCIYELRGGGLIEAYQNRSIIYRYVFKLAINNASVLLCQGQSYIPFLQRLTKQRIIHYPNFVSNHFLPKTIYNHRNKTSDVHLVYFGRITESKNIEFLLEICKELKLSEFKFDMEIIGVGEQAYLNHLNSAIQNFELTQFLKISGALPNVLLKEVLINKHFFIFPSKEKREGQSNALTEAMACGLVPICSNAGFNSEIVGDEALIISKYNPMAYAKKIIEIWESNQWDKFSEYVNDRVKKYYSQSVAEKVLRQVYNI